MGIALFAEPETSAGRLLSSNNRTKFVALAARYEIPAIYALSAYAYEGGLMSYMGQISMRDLVNQYIGRILRGAKPQPKQNLELEQHRFQPLSPVSVNPRVSLLPITELLACKPERPLLEVHQTPCSAVGPLS